VGSSRVHFMFCLRFRASQLTLCAGGVCAAPCRYKIEQELGTEIKPIPPHIEEKLYCM
jgi:hypothetical protein